MSLSTCESYDKNYNQAPVSYSNLPLFDQPERHEAACAQPIAIPANTSPSVQMSHYPLNMYSFASANCSNTPLMVDARTDLLSVPSPSFGSFCSATDMTADTNSIDLFLDEMLDPMSPLSSSYTSATMTPEPPTVYQDLLSSGLDDTPLFGFPSSPAESHISDAWLSPALMPATLDNTYAPSASPSPNPFLFVESMFDQYLVITSPPTPSQHYEDPSPATSQETPARRPRSRTLHRCPHCSHTSNRANNMKEHIMTHDPNREKNFKCEICDKRFARKHDMKRHVKSHARSSKTNAL